MNAAEVARQQERIARFHALETREAEILSVLAEMKEPKVQGSGPFTGNTRESRTVTELTIAFSQTRGGAPTARILLKGVNLSACSFGAWLEKDLTAQLEVVRAQMAEV